MHGLSPEGLSDAVQKRLNEAFKDPRLSSWELVSSDKDLLKALKEDQTSIQELKRKGFELVVIIDKVYAPFFTSDEEAIKILRDNFFNSIGEDNIHFFLNDRTGEVFVCLKNKYSNEDNSPKD